ncbi:UDP-glucuronosyltransferase 2C1-like [Diadema setosum]|uniref:UDP-glucuronosyltransferase 2C1-like n=1 Tax=Diadema setosum TaxID=31175 RepID=UPI003B3BDAF3
MVASVVKVLIVLQIIGLTASVSGRNILISSGYGGGSHFIAGSLVGKALAERGHNVTMLIGDAFSYRAKDPLYLNLTFVIFNHSGSNEEVINRIQSIGDIVSDSWFIQLVKYQRIIEAGFSADCKKILEDDAVIRELKKGEFDVMIMDTVWLCSFLIARKVGPTPVIGVSPVSLSVINHLSAGNPIYPAFMPDKRLTSGLPQKMNFFQRLGNALVIGLCIQFVYPFAFQTYDALIAEHNLGPNGLTFLDLIKNDVMLWLVNTDFAYEFPMHITPNIIPIGGLTAGPPKPLSQELEDFMLSSGEHGVVIFSLGSYLNFGKDLQSLKSDIVQVFADAFAQLDQKVIWHMKDARALNRTLPSNVKTLSWIPQNDLLGHNKTRVFMFHGGNNGLNELAYHGVPAIVIPLMTDGPDAAERVRTREIGVILDKMNLTTDSILSALREVLDNDKYAKNAKRVSAISRDRPMPPRERAAFWVEHVMKHGGDHLRSSYKDLTLVESSLLDVFAFLTICLFLIVLIIYVIVRRLCILLKHFACSQETKRD